MTRSFGPCLCSALLLLLAQSWQAPRVLSPQSDYIVIESNSGFANRVRVLAAYLYLKDNILNVSHIVMVWDSNAECTGQFTDVMMPIANVSFIASSDASRYELAARFRMAASYSTFGFILQRFGVNMNERSCAVLFSQVVGNLIRPASGTWAEAIDFVERNDICHSWSVHIRSTDFDKYADRNKLPPPVNCSTRTQRARNVSSVFLMTDSPLSRSTYIKENPNIKIITYGDFSESSEFSLRRTTLHHTVTEVLIAAHSRHSCGNRPSSSLYGLIIAYRQVLKHKNMTNPADILPQQIIPMLPQTVCAVRESIWRQTYNYR